MLPFHIDLIFPILLTYTILFRLVQSIASHPLRWVESIAKKHTATMALPLATPRLLSRRAIHFAAQRSFSSSTSKRLADQVRIVEVGPRDGLQNEKKSISPEVKIELVRRLAQTGLQTIEAGSFVHPKWTPQMAASDQVLSSILANAPPSPTPTTYQWLLPNSKGLDNFMKVMATAPSAADAYPTPPPSPSADQSIATTTSAPRHEVSIFLAATETFSQKNTNCSISESLARFAPLMATAKAADYPVRAYISVALGCPFEGPDVSPHRVAELAASLLEMGADEISVADTTGMGTAPRTRALLRTLRDAGVRTEDIALHFHDTFGQALVNSMVALDHGVRTFDCAVGGLGGCPYSPGATGNVATEDLVYFLHSLGVDTGVDLEEVSRIGDWITKEIGKENSASAGKAILAKLKREAGEQNMASK